MADFYAARDNTMPPLPWPSIAPPITPTKVEEILTSGLENYVPDEDIATEDRAPSGNVRGPEYFSEILDFKRKDRNNG